MTQTQATEGAPEFVTAKEYAAHHGVSLKTVMRHLRSGKLASDMKLPGPTGAHLFRRDRLAP